MKLFKGDPKKGTDYTGGRDADSIAAAVRAGGPPPVTGPPPPPALSQLLGAESWEAVCGTRKLCLVAVLPHILDDGAEKRNTRLTLLGSVVNSVAGGRKAGVGALWLEAGAQPGLEAALGVGMTPALYAVSAEKGVAVPYRGAFELEAANKWVAGLAVRGGGGSVEFPKGWKVVEGAAWDGKDGAAAAGEEFDLADL